LTISSQPVDDILNKPESRRQKQAQTMGIVFTKVNIIDPLWVRKQPKTTFFSRKTKKISI